MISQSRYLSNYYTLQYMTEFTDGAVDHLQQLESRYYGKHTPIYQPICTPYIPWDQIRINLQILNSNSHLQYTITYQSPIPIITHYPIQCLPCDIQRYISEYLPPDTITLTLDMFYTKQYPNTTESVQTSITQITINDWCVNLNRIPHGNPTSTSTSTSTFITIQHYYQKLIQNHESDYVIDQMILRKEIPALTQYYPPLRDNMALHAFVILQHICNFQITLKRFHMYSLDKSAT
jgi:hypothetical protein